MEDQSKICFYLKILRNSKKFFILLELHIVYVLYILLLFLYFIYFRLNFIFKI